MKAYFSTIGRAQRRFVRRPSVNCRRAQARFLAIVVGVGLGLLCACDQPDPTGERAILGKARFNHTLEGPLGATPVATGSRFLLSANTDGCDRLSDTLCEDVGELLVSSSNEEVVSVVARADGQLGALAEGPGSAVLYAIGADDRVIDLLAVEVATAVRIGLTDQPRHARAPRAVPLTFGVRADDLLDVRPVLVDRDGRVLLSGNDARVATAEVREGASLFVRESVTLGELMRLRAPSAPISTRFVLRSAPGGSDASVYRAVVGPPTGVGRLRIEVLDVEAMRGVGVVAADLCAVHEIEGRFEVGHGFTWTAPWGFAVQGLGVTPFSDDATEASRCVRVVRYDDRDLVASETFRVSKGPSDAQLPLGVLQGHVAAEKPWFQWAFENTREQLADVVSGLADPPSP